MKIAAIKRRSRESGEFDIPGGFKSSNNNIIEEEPDELLTSRSESKRSENLNDYELQETEIFK
jgi:hypothetical protein